MVSRQLLQATLEEEYESKSETNSNGQQNKQQLFQTKPDLADLQGSCKVFCGTVKERKTGIPESVPVVSHMVSVFVQIIYIAYM